MEPNEDSLDERLRRAARPHPAVAARIAAGSLAERHSQRGVPLRWVAAGVSGLALVGVLGLLYWPRPQPPVPAASAEGDATVVLIRAPDGSSAIFGAGATDDQVPPGSGFVISEGEPR